MMKLNVITTDADRMLLRLQRLAAAKMQSAPVQAAKYLHKSVRHSIRISPKPSKPGKPPHTRQSAALKNAISSRVERSSGHADVYVGLSRAMGSKASLTAIAGLHETGGTVSRADPFRLGMYGPVRKDDRYASARWGKSWLGKGYVFARLKTDAMVRRANDLANAAMPSRTATYPARPFLKPALDKAMKAPGFLKIFSLKK